MAYHRQGLVLVVNNKFICTVNSKCISAYIIFEKCLIKNKWIAYDDLILNVVSLLMINNFNKFTSSPKMLVDIK